MDQDSQDLTPDLDNEERKKLGLVYYKPITKELAEYLEATKNNEIKEKEDFSKDENVEMNQFEKIKNEIQNELKELDVMGEW